MRKAAQWLLSIQNSDGGWGEDGESYKLDYRGYEPAPSTASQTAWALLGLMAAGEVDHPSVAKGIDYLLETQGEDGFWDEARFTATGFPRVFYLRYHGYSKFFPLWALARYRNLEGRQHHVRSGRDVSEEWRTPGFVVAATGLRAEARIAARSAVSEPSPGAGRQHGSSGSSGKRSPKEAKPSSVSALPPVWHRA